MTLAALLLCATQVNAQTARVADRELIGAWTMEWMQYDGEKKIVCGKANGEAPIIETGVLFTNFT